NAECAADGKCKCRSGFEGDGIENCTRIGAVSSSPSIASTGARSPLATTSPSAITVTPKGKIVSTDEKENPLKRRRNMVRMALTRKSPPNFRAAPPVSRTCQSLQQVHQHLCTKMNPPLSLNPSPKVH
ncbi:hypothetical protein ANCCAN_30205, partial [Ancylostoma caninum]